MEYFSPSKRDPSSSEAIFTPTLYSKHRIFTEPCKVGGTYLLLFADTKDNNCFTAEESKFFSQTFKENRNWFEKSG